jgi:uncharacterized circularly permuted ATP-grasp superfamily protein
MARARGCPGTARLLDLVLADLYGPRAAAGRTAAAGAGVAHRGICAPVVANGARRRPAPRRLRSRRSPDGVWWYRHRTQAPSGAGYALENRLALSRSFPELFRDCHVARLAGFFAGVRAMLAHVAPRQREQPRVVLLTPGPFNETYFEHAFLARYLGYTLVQGGDPGARSRRLAKTLEGLERRRHSSPSDDISAIR